MLLESDVLVIDEESVVLTNDFGIYDHDNNQIGQITVDGGALKRLVMGNREFTVKDGDTASFIINDVPNIGLDHFKVTTPSGDQIALIIKNISLVAINLTIKMHDGTELKLKDDWGYKYRVHGPDGKVAVIDRGWKNLKAALLDRDQYQLTFVGDPSAEVRQATIAAAITIDRIRAKSDDDDD